jgi:hypothetical protein
LLRLAVQTKSPAHGDSEEVWMVMVRRSGNEGGCSQDALAPTHGFPGHDMRFSLPTTFKTQSSVQFYTDYTQVAAYAADASDGNTVLVVPNPPDGKVIFGEIHLSR